MVNEGKAFKAEDDAHRARVTARNSLEAYAYGIKQTLSDDKAGAGRISDAERDEVRRKTEETIAWLDSNHTAEKDEYEGMQKELEAVCKPIVTKMYGNPAGETGGAGTPTGATVEEVD